MSEPYAQGEHYHVYNRGCNKEPIFFKPQHYLHLIKQIKRTYKQAGIDIIAYCLMPTHYHFLIRQQTNRPISDWIKYIFNGYTQTINQQMDRSGTLFQGRVKHKLIDQEAYLIHLARYIHRNPLVAGLVDKLEDWPYSNYLEWIHARNGTIINHQFVNTFFPKSGSYRKYVLGSEQNSKVQKGLEAYIFDEI